jgi:hypothetical protein
MSEEPPAKRTKGGGEDLPAAQKKEDVDFVAQGAAEEDIEDTLEEEEFAMGGKAEQAAEASELKNEADMPLEQLLAQYGLSKGQLENTAAFDAEEAGGDEDEEEEESSDDEWEIKEKEAKRAAKGWYNTVGPFAGTYELDKDSCRAFQNNTREWSLRYRVVPDSGTEYFVRFKFNREHTRHGYKFSVDSISESTASESMDAEPGGDGA